MFTTERVTITSVLLNEIEPLAAAHYNEVTPMQVQQWRPFKLDREMILACESAGYLVSYLCRDASGAICGYMTWQIVEDADSVGSLYAQQGSMYVKDSADNAVFYSLLHASLERLRDLRVTHVRLVAPEFGRGRKLSRLFETLGGIEMSTEYWLKLKGTQ